MDEGQKKKMEKKYYYGNEISQYGLENGRVDYGTLAKCFGAVLNNDIMSLTYDIGYLEQVSGTIDNSEEIEELEEKKEELEEKQKDLEDDLEETQASNESSKKGLALLQEHYLNPWQSDYYVIFARYDDKEGTNMILDVFEKRIDYDDE